MKTILFLIVSASSVSASAMYPLTPYEAVLKFPGGEKVELRTQGSKVQEVVVAIGNSVINVPKAELSDLPQIFIESIRYEMLPSSRTRDVCFDAGERGDPFANPPIPAKIIHVTLHFNDGVYTRRITETPIDEITSEVRMKDVGKPETLRATLKKQPPLPIQKNTPQDK